jgi:quinol monooxygenase YgiN
MEFVQIVEFKTSKIDEVRRLLEEYQNKRRADGKLVPSVLECQDRDAQGVYVSVVRFPSADAAMQNSNDPETGAMAQKLAALCDGPPKFRNLDLVAARS